MENNYTVYMHKNKINGKVYIGITRQEPKKRWLNGKGYKNNQYMINAIKKYNWNNFEHIILFKNLTKEEAEQKEIELIQFYKSNERNFGYNIENGGSSIGFVSEETKKKISVALKNKKISNITKEKISKANKGKHHTEETKEKMRKAKINYRPWICGKHFDEKIKEKISINTKKAMQKIEVKQKIQKKILCIENNIIYNSLTFASKENNIKIENICKCCKGERKTAGGYHWRYYEE